MGDSTPPNSSDLEFDFSHPQDTGAQVDSSLAPVTPLPRCLTDGAGLILSGGRKSSPIPRAPRVPHFCLAPCERSKRSERPDALLSTSHSNLGLPSDRVGPGSAALVSTFRPKPVVRSCYSVKGSSNEERVYRTRRTPVVHRAQPKKPIAR